MPQDSRGASALWDFDFKYDDLNVVRRRTASDIGALETSSSCKEEQPEVSDPIAMDSAVDLVAKTESDGGHSPDAAPRTNHHAEDGASPPPPPPPPGPPSPDDPQSQKQSRPDTLPPDLTTMEAPPAPAAATAPAESNPYIARSPAANSSSSSSSSKSKLSPFFFVWVAIFGLSRSSIDWSEWFFFFFFLFEWLGTTETVKNVLKRWGKKVGETAKKAEDFSINTWQHREYCKF
ncbi:hypothetical protein BHE74_00034133 [Ensete ventricosum]|nr:hypothetical protein BHE74_00034133 [Ensete ventricosum]RZS20776.1 hypothetical protein BHM03_00053333 [Ensete ventricosum]